MNVTLQDGEHIWSFDLTQATDISIRLEFDGEQPNAFGIDRAHAAPYRAGEWVGDVSQGGSVNCFVVTMCPHGNGTHTECVGHIVTDRVAVADILEDTLIPSLVVSVSLETLAGCGERYDGDHESTDVVVSRRVLEAALENRLAPRGLVIRTLPNAPAKREATYSGNNPPYLTHDAMQLVRELNIKHLLVDLPSVDRERDGGGLHNHRLFWDVPTGANSFHNVPSAHTITEMIFVPDAIQDGPCIVSIQIPHFALDAAPSRVRLFPAQIQTA